MPSLQRLKASLEHCLVAGGGGSAGHEIQRAYRCQPSEAPSHAARFLRMVRMFEDRYGDAPDVRLLRAPGRVNLVGEHTDYNGYPVLPMAIERDIAFLAAPVTERTITVCNTDRAFAPRTFALDRAIRPFFQGDWGNYVKASVNGLIADGVLPPTARGLRAVVDGNIPDSAGLSSSAALVVVCALAALSVNAVAFEKLHLAEVLAKAERYVGTEGGGMDQAISLLGQAGTALKIDFFPLRVEAVPFPNDHVVVVSNSMVRAAKSGGVRNEYNRRVVECRLAAALGAHAASRRLTRTIHTSLLSDLAPEKLGLQDAEIDSLVRSQTGESPLTMLEVAVRLGMPVEELKETYCRLRSGALFDEPADGLKLWKRYRHVVTEARRVGLTREAFRQGDIGGVGQLMRQSHESCRDDYEVSCPELETLVSLARMYKAVGSRLTGAGFGGCTVSLVPRAEAADFARRLWEGYCKQRPEFEHVRSSDAVFITSPADGAGELVCTV